MQYETQLARLLHGLGILKDLQESGATYLSVEMVTNYLASAVEKALAASEAVIEFDNRRRALEGAMYQGLLIYSKGFQLHRALLRDECENTICIVDTLRSVYDLIEEQNEIPLSEIY